MAEYYQWFVLFDSAQGFFKNSLYLNGITGRIVEDSYIGRTHHRERVNVGLTFLDKEG
jgi:hypothetical protein